MFGFSFNKSIEQPELDLDLDKPSEQLEKTVEALDKPFEDHFNDIKPVEVKQELRETPDEMFKAFERYYIQQTLNNYNIRFLSYVTAFTYIREYFVLYYTLVLVMNCFES